MWRSEERMVETVEVGMCRKTGRMACILCAVNLAGWSEEGSSKMGDGSISSRR